MIVKNEEKYLEKCLTALSPLLNGVSSELVIVDTGSDDNTVEIAKKFTDKVYHFEWVKDFAAARNFGLDKCSGEWFMFLDADEIFDSDVSEMVEFFNDKKKSSGYNTCFYDIRNFTVHNKATYVSINSQRIARRVPTLRFFGEIHEQFDDFNRQRHPLYYFNTFVEHYGYSYETDEMKQAKMKRNLEILRKKQEDNPEDTKVMCEIIDCLGGNEHAEERGELIDKAIELAIKAEGVTGEMVYVKPYQCAMSNYIEHQPDKALEYIKGYIKIAAPDEAHLVDAYGYRVTALFRAKQYSKVKAAAEKYWEFYNKYFTDKLDKTSTQLCGLQFIDINKYKAVNEITAISLAHEGHFNEVFVYLNQSANLGQHDCYYLAMKAGFDLSSQIPRLKSEQIEKALKTSAELYSDFPKLVLDYCQSDKFTSSIKELLFAVHALEFASIRAGKIDTDLDYNEKLELYTRFITMAALYVNNVYNPNLLGDDTDIGVLPVLHRFGYYCAVSLKALDGGDKLTYIRTLKKALDEYIDMKKVIEFLLRDFSANL
jgi:glycosyltransferase involved in cell wall biosynthesis